MSTDSNKSTIVKELTDLIRKGNAHASFEDAVANLPVEKLTITPAALPYNIWQLTEHIRIVQWDIVEFCINPKHKSPKWPDEFWVDGQQKVTASQWEKTLRAIDKDKERFLKILQDTSSDLYETLPHGTGQNLFREALLIADHNAYHTAEIIILRRLLKIWK